MRRLVPAPVMDDLDVDALAAHYAYPPDGAVRANMVTSVDGAVTVDGRSEGISNAIDWKLFGLQRALADVILVGSGTARAEGYGPGRVRADLARLRSAGQEAAPRLALVTRSGDLDPAADFFSGATSTLVVTHGRVAPRRLDALRDVAEVLVCGDDDVDLRAARDALRERGMPRILTEGGPHLLGTLSAADLIDEVALTVTPSVVGGDSPRMVSGAPADVHSLTLSGLLEHEGTLFLHYRRVDR